jgi:anti-anti-sigma regulatory factor
LPNVVLAAIVLVAVKGLINIPELRRVWRLSRMEFWVAMAAFAGVLLLGILKGVLLAALVSILLLIRRAAHPHVARLGRVPGTDRYSDCERNPDNLSLPGVLILRVESGLFYFNADHVRAYARRYTAEAGDDLRLVICDLSSSPYVDITGARMLGEIQRELAARGAKLRLVEARAAVRDLVRAELGTSVGEITRRISIGDTIKEEGGGVGISAQDGWARPPTAVHCCLLPLMLPTTPPATAPTAAPVQPLPPAMAAIPAPAAAPIAAPVTVPCCCGVMLVHPSTLAATAMATIVPIRFMFRLR